MILEVGLGGRLDATNIVPQPVVCGITPLGYDHMDVLGHTLRVSKFLLGRTLKLSAMPRLMKSA